MAKKQPSKQIKYPDAPKSSDFKRLEMGIDSSPGEVRNVLPFMAIAIAIFAVFTFFIINQGTTDSSEQQNEETADYLFPLAIEVTAVEGQAEVSYDGVDWQALSTSSPLPQGSYIRTAEDSGADLSLDEGRTTINLGEKSQLYISSANSVALTFEPMQGSVRYQFRLISNRTYGIDVVDKILKAETAELVSYTNAGETEVYVISGGLWQGSDTSVNAGQVYTAKGKVTDRQLPGFLGRFVDDLAE